uniref:NADH-ubiquinone oxidoreductase chain 4L n=1 Tax=Microphis brachyurus TaxID=161466 RepID=A0A0N7AQC3_MICBA|nr:NADH dehydrogenase subunit 4L [Oostethus brachyurus]
MTLLHLTLSTCFILALAGLSFHRTHLLSALLCLEGMMLSLYLSLSLWTLQLDSPSLSSGPMLLLAFSACEAAIGLALLVATSRTHGTDRMSALNILQC